MPQDKQPGKGVVSLTTDFGLVDEYVAVLKAVLVGLLPGVRIVDISHHIPRGNTTAANRTLGRAWPYFPDGTVHLVVVDPGVGTDRSLLAIETANQVFVGPDNGVFADLLDRQKLRVHTITNNDLFLPRASQTFHGRDIMAPVAARLAAGMELTEVGPMISAESCVTISTTGVQKRDGGLYGQVVGIDSFGNVCTNISDKDLESLAGQQLRIEAAATIIEGLSTSYQDQQEGSPLAILDSCDKLELAINRGSFAEHTAIKIGDPVVVMPA
jgi:S-adenosylmethionine hydrolase